ncbi:hypothetical protein BOX15_Mlig030940g1 [Macrostomum lignano]|uniref:Stabilizer of axonemal microtubules 2 n=2 Tax=Macrostomum lignano TaxID=282301 RepID=A0A1I8J1J1_9PLAT|nr:hypothetical protein BOX15_Mlig030940g1 [Macrostomum lignano]
MSARPTQCICQICNCGRHRCKLHPNRPIRDGPCQLSEYTNKFIPHAIVPVGSFKPTVRAAGSEGPLSDKTTHRVDFVPHPLDRPKQHQAEQYRPPSGQFDGITMYSKEYTEKRADRAVPAKREVKRGVAGEFRGEPTYKHDYRKWDMPKLERSRTNPQWEPSKTPFGGLPTYTTDYVAHPGRPSTSCKPNEVARMSSAPLENQTDYRQSFVPHPLERRKEKERQVWARPSAPFDGLSTFTRDFTPKSAMVRSSMKPDATAFASNAPFKDDTTHRLDFKPWELQRHAVHKAEPYVPPEGHVDGTTTYVKDYPAHKVVRETYTRRPERGLPSGEFNDATDYKDNFKKWALTGREKVGPNQTYQPNSAPFEGQSTTASHFVPHPMDVRRSFKPSQDAARTEGPFDGTTLYRMEYVPKHIEPCPAALLDTETSRYLYKETDDTGHKFYQARNGRSASAANLNSRRLVSAVN